MKKLVLLFAIFAGLAVISCDPLDDTYDELDAINGTSDLIAGQVDYTLTEDNYKTDLSLSFENFGSQEEARELIPTILSATFPTFGDGSQANVTYNLFSRRSTESSLIVYEVQTEDYDADPATERFDNFSNDSQIFTFLNRKFPNLANRTLVSLTYDFFTGSSTEERNNGFLFIDGSFTFIQGFSAAEYLAVGESFPNFSNEDEADEKIPFLLKDKLRFQQNNEGDIVATMYKLFVTDTQDVDMDGSVTDRTTYSYVKNFIFNGTDFVAYNNILEQTLQFGNENGVWLPDNTINYTFTPADFAAIGAALATKYPGPASSAGRFGNFDRRGGNANEWKDDMLLEAINVVLDRINPSAAEGQKYVTSYAVFTGSAGTESMRLIKADGMWVNQ